MRLLRTIRLDDSDARVYEAAAEPGEWAVTGSFAFLDADAEALAGKRLEAFRRGFLGTRSFGWSTLVEIAEIEDDEYQEVVDHLAAHFVERYGAPHIAAALPVAGEEVDYAAGLCDRTLHTLLAIEREFGEDGVVESLRVVRPSAAGHERLRLFGPAEDD